jgi:hypothetical protein
MAENPPVSSCLTVPLRKPSLALSTQELALILLTHCSLRAMELEPWQVTMLRLGPLAGSLVVRRDVRRIYLLVVSRPTSDIWEQPVVEHHQSHYGS